MDITKLTIGEAREIAALFTNHTKSNSHPWRIGKNYLIRTVTMIQTGRLVDVTEHELVLEHAAWIVYTGRFSDALKSGVFDEVEPYPDGEVIVGRGSIIDACTITNIPRDQK